MWTVYPREVLEKVAEKHQVPIEELALMLADGSVPAPSMADIEVLMRAEDASTAFPAAPAVPGQAESRTAYKIFQDALDASPFREEYLALRAEGWTWRQAVFIAWSSMPSSRREPGTKKDLAERLGLKSDRTFRAWCKKKPEILKRIEEFTVSTLGGHLADVIDAWVKVAKTPDPQAHKDRITYLETMKVYKRTKNVELTGEDGGPVEMVDLTAEFEKDMEKLAAMAPGQAEDDDE